MEESADLKSNQLKWQQNLRSMIRKTQICKTVLQITKDCLICQSRLPIFPYPDKCQQAFDELGADEKDL
jgi:hypothetical protein